MKGIDQVPAAHLDLARTATQSCKTGQETTHTQSEQQASDPQPRVQTFLQPQVKESDETQEEVSPAPAGYVAAPLGDEELDDLLKHTFEEELNWS